MAMNCTSERTLVDLLQVLVAGVVAWWEFTEGIRGIAAG
jgi:hypothetical protein